MADPVMLSGIPKGLRKTAGNLTAVEIQFNKVQTNTSWKEHANLFLHTPITIIVVVCEV